jgi:hypothetical protein
VHDSLPKRASDDCLLRAHTASCCSEVALMMAVAAILTSKLSVGQREAVASIDGAALLLQALGLANDGSLKPFG